MRFSVRRKRVELAPMDRGDVAILAEVKMRTTHPEPQWPQADAVCPGCGGTDLYWSLTCHTYAIGDGDKKRWMSCRPCDSAIHYGCAGHECDWPGYTHGLNPGNPRAAANEQNRPPWLPEKLFHGEHGIALTRPGIRAIWDDDDD